MWSSHNSPETNTIRVGRGFQQTISIAFFITNILPPKSAALLKMQIDSGQFDHRFRYVMLSAS